MSLDTTIHGDPASIHALADWLQGVKDAVDNADVQMTWVASQMAYDWQGGAASAFHDAVGALRKSQFPVSDYLHDAIEVFHAYANRLSRGREYFDAILGSARGMGLTVRGLVIAPPTTWLTYCPNMNAPATTERAAPQSAYATLVNGPSVSSPVPPDVAEYNAYLGRLSAYNDASKKVGSWEGELDQWLADRMAPLIGRIEEMSQVAQVYAALRDGSELIVDGALEAADARVVVRLADWRLTQDALSDLAKDARDAARSGNPARRAAYKAFDFSENAVKIGDLEVKIGKVAHCSKIIPIAGTVIEISLAGYDISQGVSESSVLAGLGGGAAGTAAGGALGGLVATALAVSNPIGWVAGGAVLLGAAGSAGGKWLWEATVDLDTRESIDYWIEENVLWDPTTGTLTTG